MRGLADAHIVGQAAAEAELAQELHPAHALLLVVAQLADEARGLLHRLHALEVLQPLADPGKTGVERDLGLSRQQRVQRVGFSPVPGEEERRRVRTWLENGRFYAESISSPVPCTFSPAVSAS